MSEKSLPKYFYMIYLFQDDYCWGKERELCPLSDYVKENFMWYGKPNMGTCVTYTVTYRIGFACGALSDFN